MLEANWLMYEKHTPLYSFVITLNLSVVSLNDSRHFFSADEKNQVIKGWIYMLSLQSVIIILLQHTKLNKFHSA